MGCDLSVVIPAYNEAENLVELVPATVAALDRLGIDWELLVVDDGSVDDTPKVMAELRGPAVHYLRLRRNLGKSAALSVGLRRARGDRIVLMDADGQDDPVEMSTLLDALDRGADLVTGRRRTRQDRFVKRSTSRLYNAVTARVTGVQGRDFNSGYKAMSSAVASSLALYGEMHRYIPVLAAGNGFHVTEVDVAHRERLHGKTKFGRARFWRGFLDLFTVKFLTTYGTRPFHLFGGSGIGVGLVASILLAWSVLATLVSGSAAGPPLVLDLALIVIAVQLVGFGLLAEVLVHAFHRRQLAPVDDVQEDRTASVRAPGGPSVGRGSMRRGGDH